MYCHPDVIHDVSLDDFGLASSDLIVLKAKDDDLLQDLFGTNQPCHATKPPPDQSRHAHRFPASESLQAGPQKRNRAQMSARLSGLPISPSLQFRPGTTTVGRSSPRLAIPAGQFCAGGCGAVGGASPSTIELDPAIEACFDQPAHSTGRRKASFHPAATVPSPVPGSTPPQGAHG